MDEVPAGRKKLNLKPRNEAAVAAAAVERSSTGKAVRGPRPTCLPVAPPRRPDRRGRARAEPLWRGQAP
jgi:hypothetical protein